MSKWLFFIGIGVLCLAGIAWVTEKLQLPLGRLPGDFSWHKENASVYFPLVTSIVLSILLTIILNLIIWLWRK